MKIIGLTGGIGSGKSTVAGILADNGAYVIDADKVGHEVYYKGGEAWDAVVEAFGTDILNENADIDRRKLAAIVFHDNEKLNILNDIVHPLIVQEVLRRIDNARSKGVELVVVEAALLIEAGWHEMVDEVWLITADQEIRLHRIMQRDGISIEEARLRMQSQMPDDERAEYADIIIVNDDGIEDLKRKVKEALQREGGQ
ncbi:dephospho-CoA kinase [Mahella sp.]|uniref:dephospho-CoA kinase n=1 Tax=Mahella sp. TaxID=2798721 RepID=UPI0025BBE38E|nr:dephospho-CoA kinase [Mahella sp.]MBZ4665869.1 dephospho-CoA kinase [Mahella sp.]